MGENAEAVRRKWVKHDGTKELVVERNSFVLGKNNDWEGVVHEFGDQIAQNAADGVVSDMTPAFSGWTADERTACVVTVMDACKSYFTYVVRTKCGFPRIVMDGHLQEWQLLRETTASLLTNRCEESFAASWGKALLPLLDKLIEEYENGVAGRQADAAFFNSMVKRGGTTGSGA